MRQKAIIVSKNVLERGSHRKSLCSIVAAFSHCHGFYESAIGRTESEQEGCSFCRRVQMISQNPKESLSHHMNILEAFLKPLDVQQMSCKEDMLSEQNRSLMMSSRRLMVIF